MSKIVILKIRKNKYKYDLIPTRAEFGFYEEAFVVDLFFDGDQQRFFKVGGFAKLNNNGTIVLFQVKRFRFIEGSTVISTSGLDGQFEDGEILDGVVVSTPQNNNNLM